MILFTADWHIKLGQKNVPTAWACSRYEMFFEQVQEAIDKHNVTLHIIGGDLFDRVPSMDELTLYFDFVSRQKVRTIIYDGNHEATKKNHTFFTNLIRATKDINPLVEVVTETYYEDNWCILPYADLHKKKQIENIKADVLFTHVRGEIPPHVVPEVDLERFDKFDVVFAGDLHAHENTQRNIVYPGSPMTTSFHRNEVQTGYLIIDDNFDWTWHKFELPQLIRKTVEDPNEMEQTDFHHTIYELTGDVQDLAKVKNSDLLDKKVVKREMEATLDLQADMTMSDELALYLKEIMALDETKIRNIMGVFNDYSSEIEMG
ncbi:metallophosphoesterase [Pseudomonadales bacterium]|jgi:DNA repair exonuclease SbcCD nuclease subunit|nr:metallophosphoesterase [Pseudomonadales bacterium]